MSHAFNDWNVMPEHSNRIYQALKAEGVPVQAYYHQGGHGGPPPIKLMNRWFTRYLHGEKNNVEKDARAWIVREGADRNKPKSYEDYPNPEASPVTFHLAAGAPEMGKLTISTNSTQGKETIVDNFSFSGSALAQADWTEHRLMYLTEKLIEAVHLSGTPRITVKLASNKPTANLSVWLVSLPWNGNKNAKITDNIITRGWADPQNHRSLTESEPLVPGRFYEMKFDLQPDDQVIPVGQQIGLMIMSSDREFTLRPDPGTELTIDLDATNIQLPLVGGIKAFSKATTKKTEAENANSKQNETSVVSSSVNSSVSYVVKDTTRGELHYKNANGEAALKVINPDGKVLYDGPINTKKQKSKVPTEAMKWFEKVKIKVEEVTIKVKPPAVN